MSRGSGRVAGAAALIAVLTVASRVAGFGRTAVFAWSVGPTDLGDIYFAVNTIPNIIFEIVAGGALAGLVVPLLAGAVARGERAEVAATASALLGRVLAGLTPLAVLVVVWAGPIVEVIAPDASPAQLAVGARMLRVFAPQLPLYGLGIVLTGVLQAHRRFAWPVLAPLLSSLTVIGSYACFALVDGARGGLAQLDRTGELVLSVGTTAGVAVLSGCLLVPVRRLGLRLRPAWRLAGQLRRTAGSLALAGALTVAAQQLALLVTLRLAMAAPDGVVVQYNLAQQVYLLPWAVLAVPVATAAFPVLAAAEATADRGAYRATLAGAVRAVVLLGCLGAALLAAAGQPAARLFVTGDQAGAVAAAIAGFAPGLLGYGLFALLSRALYARGDSAPAVLATVAGWAVTAAAAYGLTALLPAGRSALALALANSAGMTVLGGVLLLVVARRVGAGALAGLPRAATAGLVAAGLAAAAGYGTRRAVGSVTATTPGAAAAVVEGMLCGAVVGGVFLAVAYAGDRRDLARLAVRLPGRAVARRLARAARPASGATGTDGIPGAGRDRGAGGPDEGAGEPREEAVR